MAAGDKAAYASQTERISAVGAAILAAKPEVWSSKRETNSAVIYLLSGGQPRDVVRLVESGAVPASEIPLMRGVLAYVLGNEPEAEKRLLAIDARRLPLRLAGPMAFAQSVLETGHNSAKAIELLDLARLLAPGTLVEEAALRRRDHAGSEPLCRFIERHPTIKMLALSFLILIGMVLIADGLEFHIPRGYIYFAMAFSLLIESLNMLKRKRRARKL